MAGRHLLEVSVFLLAVCLMLTLSASLTHSLARRYHGNGLDLHSVTITSYITTPHHGCLPHSFSEYGHLQSDFDYRVAIRF